MERLDFKHIIVGGGGLSTIRASHKIRIVLEGSVIYDIIWKKDNRYYQGER